MKFIRRVTPEDGCSFKFTECESIEPSVDNINNYEIIVAIKACGLAVKDFKIQADLFKKQEKDCLNVGHDVAGVVKHIGKGVTSVKVGDSVVGILPLNSDYSGCGEYCVFHEYDVVKKPSNISYEEAAACIGDCVRTYTALFYHAKVSVGDTVLIMDGASNNGNIAIQLAHHWGAKVLTTYGSDKEKQFLESNQTPIAQKIELNKKSDMLVYTVMEETGGMGVDCIIDNGVRMFTNEEDVRIFDKNSKYMIPNKHDVICCLGFSGKWVTSQSNLQLDPQDCQQLLYRGGSVCFLFDQAWILSKSQHGRYQHILRNSIKKIASGTLKCTISKIVTFDSIVETLTTLENERVGKVVFKI